VTPPITKRSLVKIYKKAAVALSGVGHRRDTLIDIARLAKEGLAEIEREDEHDRH